jgi:hypothetical protein
VLLLAAIAVAARADGGTTRLAVDRVEVTPSFLPGFARVDARVRPESLDGHHVAVASDAWRVQIGDARSPVFAIERTSSEPVSIAIVVAAVPGYQAALTSFSRRVGALLGAFPTASDVAIVTYADEVDGGHRRVAPAEVAEELGAVQAASGAVYAPALLRAVDRAAQMLASSEPGRARYLIVVSDGRDEDPTPERFRQAGRRAQAAGIVIEPIGYAPTHDRWPLRGLGELAKRTGGTFRWVSDDLDAAGGGFNDTGLGDQLANLSDELVHTVDLVALVPADEVGGRMLSISAALDGGEVVAATPVQLARPECRDRCGLGETCRSGACVPTARGARIARWLAVGGVAVVALIGLGAWARRRRARPAARPAPRAVENIAPPAAAEPAPHAGAVLVIVSGTGAGRRIDLRAPITIGRGVDCDVVLDDERVSARHARLEQDGARWRLRDLSSSTGTFMDGARIGQAVVRDRARIRIGGTELRFRASAEDA